MSPRLLLSVATIVLVAGSAGSQEPMPITTDTMEYCITLAERMADAEMPPHARLLWRNGRAMCEHGQVRDGLARLRRAMLMIKGVAE